MAVAIDGIIAAMIVLLIVEAVEIDVAFSIKLVPIQGMKKFSTNLGNKNGRLVHRDSFDSVAFCVLFQTVTALFLSDI